MTLIGNFFCLMIPSEIEIKILAKRAIHVMLGSKGLMVGGGTCFQYFVYNFVCTVLQISGWRCLQSLIWGLQLSGAAYAGNDNFCPTMKRNRSVMLRPV